MNTKVAGVAIIGAGRMGRRHIQAVRLSGLKVVGVCDFLPESLQLAAKEEGVAEGQLFSDVRTMISKTKPDCVIIATTASAHRHRSGIVPRPRRAGARRSHQRAR